MLHEIKFYCVTVLSSFGIIEYFSILPIDTITKIIFQGLTFCGAMLFSYLHYKLRKNKNDK